MLELLSNLVIVLYLWKFEIDFRFANCYKMVAQKVKKYDIEHRSN